MLKVSRAAALATVLGSLALSPAFAAPVDTTSPSGPPNSTVNLDASGHVVNRTADTSDNAVATPADGMSEHHRHMGMTGKHSPEAMREHVENRIKNLHQKLGITKEQEAQWTDVAQAMRDSEASTVSLIQERHENAKTMNAVDDLDSYQKIAQAHADGLKNVSAAFSKLYANMSDAQKQNADKVFGTYEGHPDRAGKHSK